MTRKDDIQKIIERGDVTELLRLAQGYPCSCMGAKDGEPECFCAMNSKQIREAVSVAALRHGKLLLIQRDTGSGR
jgi:hypothetical protein